MTSTREESRARARHHRASTPAPLVDTSEPDGHEWTQGEVAQQLSIHRTVLYRMEQRLELPKPRWRHRNAKGNPYRVYNAKEVANIKKILDEKRAKRDAGRHYVEEDQVS